MEDDKILNYRGLTYFKEKLDEHFIIKPESGNTGEVLTLNSDDSVSWSALPTMLTYKGYVETVADLPSEGNAIGDVYHVVETSEEYFWKKTGDDTYSWELVGPIVLVGTLNTTIVAHQDPVEDESLSGNISLHKISKTGEYSDLNNVPDLTKVTVNGTYTGEIEIPALLNELIYSDDNKTLTTHPLMFTESLVIDTNDDLVLCLTELTSNSIIDSVNNKVYKYVDDSWVEDTTVTPLSLFANGSRLAFNSITNKLFYNNGTLIYLIGTNGLTYNQYNNLSRYLIHGYVQNSGALIKKILDIPKLDLNTVYIIDLTVICNNYSENGYDYYYYGSFTITLQNNLGNWTALVTDKGYSNFGSAGISEDSLKLYVSNNNSLILAWDRRLATNGGFDYYVNVNVKTNTSYSERLIVENITFYNGVSETYSGNSLTPSTDILFLKDISTEVNYGELNTQSGTESFTLDYTSNDYNIFTLTGDSTLTINNSLCTLGVDKRVLVVNNAGADVLFTILPGSGVSTLYNMYDSQGSTCQITIPAAKIFEVNITYWGASYVSWNGGVSL